MVTIFCTLKKSLHVLKKRNWILCAMKWCYFCTHSKFGVELPKTVERTLEIDKETGTTFWADTIAKEMKTVFAAFEILPKDVTAPRAHLPQVPLSV